MSDDVKNSNKVCEVFTNDGHCLGDEWVNLDGLLPTTKEAIIHLIELDGEARFFGKQNGDNMGEGL